MTTKKDNPCKDCSDRHVGCHATCERYLEWQTTYYEYKEKVFTERSKQNRLDKYSIDRSIAAKKRYRRKKT